MKQLTQGFFVCGLVFAVLLATGCSSRHNAPPTAQERAQRVISDILQQELPERVGRFLLTAGPDDQQRCVFVSATGYNPQMGPNTEKLHSYVANFPIEKGHTFQQLSAVSSPDGWQSTNVIAGGRPPEAMPAFNAEDFRYAVMRCVSAAREEFGENAPALNGALADN